MVLKQVQDAHYTAEELWDALSTHCGTLDCQVELHETAKNSVEQEPVEQQLRAEQEMLT